ncbi:MAG: hypothetical protein LQ352_007330 [Teloschistes flavicans]|nr:MAG: hypothetical protein LQ352_007330 [Teloschistes flavicans]
MPFDHDTVDHVDAVWYMERPEHLKEEHDRVTNTIDQAHLEGIPDLVSWMDFYYWLDNFCIGKGRFGINALKNLKHPDMFWPLLSFNQNSVSVRIWIEKDLAPLNWRLLAALVKLGYLKNGSPLSHVLEAIKRTEISAKQIAPIGNERYLTRVCMVEIAIDYDRLLVKLLHIWANGGILSPPTQIVIS